MTRGRHITGVTDPKPRWAHTPHVVTADGAPLVSVEALIARLQQAAGRADIEHLCEVLATLTGTPTQVDRQAALAEWQAAVVGHVLADLRAPASAVDAEVVQLEAVQDSQRSPGTPWSAAFAAPATTVARQPAPTPSGRRSPTRKPRPSIGR